MKNCIHGVEAENGDLEMRILPSRCLGPHPCLGHLPPASCFSQSLSLSFITSLSVSVFLPVVHFFLHTRNNLAVFIHCTAQWNHNSSLTSRYFSLSHRCPGGENQVGSGRIKRLVCSTSVLWVGQIAQLWPPGPTAVGGRWATLKSRGPLALRKPYLFVFLTITTDDSQISKQWRSCRDKTQMSFHARPVVPLGGREPRSHICAHPLGPACPGITRFCTGLSCLYDILQQSFTAVDTM